MVETRRRIKMMKPKNNNLRPLVHPATMKGHGETGKQYQVFLKAMGGNKGDGVLLLAALQRSISKQIEKKKWVPE